MLMSLRRTGDVFLARCLETAGRTIAPAHVRVHVCLPYGRQSWGTEMSSAGQIETEYNELAVAVCARSKELSRRSRRASGREM